MFTMATSVFLGPIHSRSCRLPAAQLYNPPARSDTRDCEDQNPRSDDWLAANPDDLQVACQAGPGPCSSGKSRFLATVGPRGRMPDIARGLSDTSQSAALQETDT